MAGISRFISRICLPSSNLRRHIWQKLGPSSNSTLIPRTSIHPPAFKQLFCSWEDGDKHRNVGLNSDSDDGGRHNSFQRPSFSQSRRPRRGRGFYDEDDHFSDSFGGDRFQRSRQPRGQRFDEEDDFFSDDFGGDRFQQSRRPRRGQSFGDEDSYYSDNFGAGRFGELGGKIKKKDWSAMHLGSIEKNFYVVHPEVAERSEETIQEFYDRHNITISKGERPVPLSDFHEANFPEKIVQHIERQKWSTPTPIQSVGWPIALSGHNTVGIAQTGSGKTLGFILPALVHIKHQRPVDRGEGPIALVMAPTRELAQQIQGVAKEYGRQLGIQSCCIFGGQSKMVQARKILQGPELMVATPGRLLDFLESGEISLDRITYAVLDEADRMLDMGFEPQIRKVLNQIRPDRQTLMWSATWPKEIQQLARDFLGDYTQVTIGSLELSANPNIQQVIKVCEWREKLGLLLNELTAVQEASDDGKMPKTLIFSQTKRMVDMLTSKLRYRRFKAMAIHGDKSQSQRDNTLQNFREGRADILVATDVAARGLDVDDIKMVINYDYPNDIDDYIHRIGRTARASKTGKAITFLTDEDAGKVKDLISILKSSGQEVDPDLQDLARLSAKFPKKSSSKSRFGSYQRRPQRSRSYDRYDGFNRW